MSVIGELGKGLKRRLRAAAERRGTWLRAMLAVVTVLAIAGIVIGYSLQATRVSLSAGEASPETIYAPHTTTYVDEQATEQLRQRAEEWVAPVYAVQPQAVAHAENEVERLFASLAARGARLDDLQGLFPTVSRDALAWAMAQPADKLTRLAEPARGIVRDVMSQSVPEDAEGVAAARQAVREAAGKLALAEPARQLVAGVGERALRPNLGYDAEATEAARRAARRAVRPVQQTVVAGEVVLHEGEVATSGDIAALRALGLLSPVPNLWQMVSVVVLCALALVAIATYLRRHQPDVYRDTRLLLLTALVAALALFAVNLVNLRGPRAELMSMLSVTAGIMIIAVLVGNRAALMVAVVESLLVGLMAQGQFALVVLTLGSSLTGLLLAGHIWPPSRLVGASATLGAVNVALVLAVNQITGGAHVFTEAWHALLYGIGAPALAVGGIYLLQRPFDIATYMRLLELDNPNEPLLRRMLEEAPGSYIDSIFVANLADAAAETVGADRLLARVGSLYHDIGKLRRPYLFTENQSVLGIGNVHEQLTPSLSSLVITSHVKDGVELAQRHRLPKVVRDLIAQHHGTSLVSFFYHQARSGPGGDALQEESFRYAAPKPQTKEAAIIMLADAAFAAVWSLPDKSPARVEAVVQQIVRERLEDGQLDECPLTLRDLSAITDAFLRLLKTMIFHTRVEYPQLAELAARRSSGHSHNHSPRSKRE
ncbi:MAG: HDIG domain-containing protein [Armatimonadota bacterium]|nr:MAG: HDIG domain-containing protein [Armatimonadota bacterium]